MLSSAVVVRVVVAVDANMVRTAGVKSLGVLPRNTNHALRPSFVRLPSKTLDNAVAEAYGHRGAPGTSVTRDGLNFMVATVMLETRFRAVRARPYGILNGVSQRVRASDKIVAVIVAVEMASHVIGMVI